MRLPSKVSTAQPDLSRIMTRRLSFPTFCRILMLPLGGALCGTGFSAETGGSAPIVGAVSVAKGDVWREVTFDAELKPYQEVELHARATGYLDKMLVDAGDAVKQGQMIAVLDAPEVQIDLQNAQAEHRRSQAEIERVKAAHEAAQLELTRLESAAKAQPALIARQDMDSARLKAASAKAALDVATEEANVSESSVKRFQTMLGYTKIEAPFAGIITRRYSDPGSLIQAGTSSGSHPLVRLSQVDRLRVTFPVSSSYVAAVKVGDDAEVRVSVLGQSFQAKIARISQKVETATRTMEAQVDLPNPGGKLTAGMYATVALKVDRKNSALVLPVEAVTREKTGSTVFLITSEKKLESRAVTVGTETPTRLEIATGLVEGDLVMVGSRAQYSPGQLVEPKVVELPKMD
jgi:RND family efflux transporter MFP subunit